MHIRIVYTKALHHARLHASRFVVHTYLYPPHTHLTLTSHTPHTATYVVLHDGHAQHIRDVCAQLKQQVTEGEPDNVQVYVRYV